MPDLYGHLTPQGVLNGSLQTIVFADNYNDLINKPSINSVELQGNKTAADLGLLTAGDIPVVSVNGQQGVVILDGDDIEYEAGTSVNSKITELEAEIGSGPVISVNGETGAVVLDGTEINYQAGKTINQKIDEVEAEIPVVSYPVTSVNGETGTVVLDGTDIEYSSGVSVNSQIDTLMTYTPVYGNTASGAIATFDTSLALPLQDCTIAINAVQESGTPSPDNVRPITGFSSVNVSVSGVNLWDEQWELGTYHSWENTVIKVVDNEHIRSKNPIRVVPNHTYYMNSAGMNVHLIVADANGNVLYRTITLNNGTFTTPADSSFVYFNMSQAYGETYNNDISINYQSSDTQYHAYDGHTTAISWQSEAGTVYGGSLDVTSGVLTVTHGCITLDGSFNYTPNGATTETSTFIVNISGKAYGRNNFISDKFKASDMLAVGNADGSASSSNVAFCLPLTVAQTVVAGKQWFSDNPTQLVYELATPITVQLTPTQISAIVGTNNIFTDTNGDTSVVYACSLKDYIDSQKGGNK